jgi:hypothetical protein
MTTVYRIRILYKYEEENDAHVDNSFIVTILQFGYFPSPQTNRNQHSQTTSTIQNGTQTNNGCPDHAYAGQGHP